jgi:sulfate adenylyltransferase subunit 1 (EFTu-like GTPase family)
MSTRPLDEGVVRVMTCGCAGHENSTLIERLLLEVGAVIEDPRQNRAPRRNTSA